LACAFTAEPGVEVWRCGGVEVKPRSANLHTSTPPHLQTLNGMGWSLKAMHRLIMLSNAYQQSTDFNQKAARVDPGNRLLWRFNRKRLEGEAVRDTILAVSGELNPKMA